jgi:hypothetical protein
MGASSSSSSSSSSSCSNSISNLNLQFLQAHIREVPAIRPPLFSSTSFPICTIKYLPFGAVCSELMTTSLNKPPINQYKLINNKQPNNPIVNVTHFSVLNVLERISSF